MYRFLVVKVKGKIVGYTSVTIAYNLFDGKRPFMTLQWVGIHPEYRHRVIDNKLFQKIEVIDVENNCELMLMIITYKFYICINQRRMVMNMQYRIATVNDIDALVKLRKAQLVDEGIVPNQDSEVLYNYY